MQNGYHVMAQSSMLLLLLLIGCCVTTEKENSLIVKQSYCHKYPPKIDTGETNFTKLVQQSDILIDKSLLIKEFLEDNGTVFLITCPRQWGKTVNVDMIRAFLQPNMDSQENKLLPAKDSWSYRLFMHGVIPMDGDVDVLKAPLLISKHVELVDKYFGKSPVIFVNPKEVFQLQAKGRVRINVGKIFEENVYLVQMLEDALNKTTNKYIKKEIENKLKLFNNYKSDSETLTEQESTTSLNFLSSLLYNFFKRDVFIIIDDYQEPWERVILSNMTSDERKEFLNMYSEFIIQTFYLNLHLEKGIITGTFPASKEWMETAFSEVIECNLETGKFMQFYGFNQREITDLFNFLNIQGPVREQVRKWYNGHEIYRQNLKIYNPWSAASFFTKHKIDFYWTNWTGNIVKKLLNVDPIRDMFRYLVADRYIMIKLEQRRLAIDEIEAIYDVMHGNSDETQKNLEKIVEKVFVFLYSLGYLVMFESESALEGLRTRMAFPNAEILVSMKYNFQQYYRDLINISRY